MESDQSHQAKSLPSASSKLENGTVADDPQSYTPTETNDQKHHNRLLDKYISVWLWSALFGASTGLVVSLITYRTDARWGSLNGILLVVLVFSVWSAVVSWRALLRYMTGYLIPKFLLHNFGDKDEKTAEINAARELRRAFECLVIAAAARVIVTLLEMAYASFVGLGPF